MSIANERTPDLTLDYGRPEPTAVKRWWDRARAEVQDRIDGVLEFAGMLLAAVGGPRRVAMVVAFALLAGGLGDCLQRDPASDGPDVMAVGGALLGCLLPLPRRASATADREA